MSEIKTKKQKCKYPKCRKRCTSEEICCKVHSNVLTTFEKSDECPICLETKRCVSQPRCDHYSCIECFKRCYYGREMPEFPYPEMENEYYEDMENSNYDYNSKWDNYREKIDEYNKKCDIIENTNENHLRKCPLCRK